MAWNGNEKISQVSHFDKAVQIPPQDYDYEDEKYFFNVNEDENLGQAF